jgi:hypothetical protein
MAYKPRQQRASRTHEVAVLTLGEVFKQQAFPEEVSRPMLCRQSQWQENVVAGLSAMSVRV